MGRDVSAPDALNMLRAEFLVNGYASAFVDVRSTSGRSLEFGISVWNDVMPGRVRGPIDGSFWRIGALFPQQIRAARKHRVRQLGVEAAIACHIAMIDMEDILLRICTSDAAITTGGCRSWSTWEPPLDMGATYHADGYVARDLALSWILLHDKTQSDFNLDLDLGLPIDVLRERVAAAPAGATISIPRRGEITREQVLATLNTPPTSLLDALETSAVPDTEWQSVEPAARHHLIEGEVHPPATIEVGVTSREHIRFIETHAPFHVRRLPNGGVMLATHPYRTLWPLWADALALLGIRS
ncbi:MAG: hypothetical protein IPM54_06560 [Polyangiaceae bacterium]|nr:hypothetical protein [Polyangiaceae bacterium]